MITLFDPNNIRADLPGILLASHGRLSQGIYESAGMITGDMENVSFCCLEEADSPDDYQKKLAEIVNAYPAGCIVLVDLAGGTPCNRLLMESLSGHAQLPIVTGINLPMLVTIISERDGKQAKELVELAIAEGREGIKNPLKELEPSPQT